MLPSVPPSAQTPKARTIKGRPTEETSQSSAGQGNPEIACKADNDHGEHGPSTSDKEDRFPSNTIRERAPEEAGQALGEGECGNEDASVEGGIMFSADLKAFHHDPSVWEA